ncbi:sensor histidine kinase [Arthrobacter sp. GMC3]|uniref:sensor histidine kinase n=1 Tax=Arthrobacter sp. GMC3 TaxID=2058894 RepID=UPI000CE4732C|nr:histidine kinase [Arthrobacter sp. GMC3]
MLNSADAGPGRSVQATWNYTLGSIVFIFLVLDTSLVLTALAAFDDRGDTVNGVLLALIVVSSAMHVRYSWFLRAGLGGGLPRTSWTLALLAPAAAAWVVGIFSPGTGPLAAIPLWLALCLLACLLPKGKHWALLAGGAVLVMAQLGLTALLSGQSPDLRPFSGTRFLLVYAAFMPFVLLTSLWWWKVVVELDRHRRMAGELAVAKERLRFSADLHDIQGHHLQVIALKSELAERMLTIDVEAAREHIHETRVIAKQALEETRSLVSGYREIALENELENAREVLSAAGAQCELKVDRLPHNPAAHRALAMAVREATTNILRHSAATTVSITLSAAADGCTLTISNNALASAVRPNKVPGSGLVGLRERLELLGGRLDTSTDVEQDRFKLQAWVPQQLGVNA